MPPRRAIHRTRRNTRRSSSCPVVSIHGDIATIQLNCTDDTPHTIAIDREGNINSSHDWKAEEVLVALGGEPSACYKVWLSYQATVQMIQTTAGISDPPGMKWLESRGWFNAVECSRCRNVRTHPTIRHYVTAKHLAVAYNGYENVIRSLQAWVAETYQVDLRYRSSPHPLTLQLFNEYSANQTTPYRLLHFAPNFLRNTFLTPRYVRSAAHLVGPYPSRILYLRSHGVTAEWLNELATSVSARQTQRARIANPTFKIALAAARNVPADKVAYYLDGGIYAHYYTYDRRHYTVEEIRALQHAV